MDQDFRKQLLLMIIDKLLFGSVIVAITIYFTVQIEGQFREQDRLRQMLQSVSNTNSNLIIQQRGDLTKSMGEFFSEVSSYTQHANRSKMEFQYLNELKDNIEISFYQVDALIPNFSSRPIVKNFIDKLTKCIRFLRTESEENLHTLSIEGKLSEVRVAYKNLLNDMGQLRMILAYNDYQKVKKFEP